MGVTLDRMLSPQDAGTAVPPIDVDAGNDLLKRQVGYIAQRSLSGYVGFMPDVIQLEPVVQIPYVDPTIRNLSDGTIVPEMNITIQVNTLANVRSSLPSTITSPAPTSILGIGGGIGTILIMLGKAVIAEIAADVSMDTLKRIGQRVVPNARIRGRTGAVMPSNQQATTQVKPEQGRSGFLPNRKHYDGPCEWWEFWCWVV